MTQFRWLLGTTCALLCSQALAQNAEPLSAIDWLSQSVDEPAAVIQTEPDVATGAAAPSVTVTPLGDLSADLAGLLPPEVTGLPRTLWAFSDEATLVALTQAETMPALPALQELLTMLMLAEADPPLGASPHGALFLARVDKLLDLGALDQAQALMEQANTEDPAIFRRWFDVGLLNGTEDAACDLMQSRPSVAPTYPARIFCLARAGDWAVAALTLNTHRVLGDVTEAEEQLLSRFLDPDLFEGEPDLPPAARVSPLVFRMREAIGQGMSTQSLPLAFAHADLRSTTGLKAQLEAAERLTRAGALDPNILQSLYTARTPSASGGVWDRVKAFQRFDAAISAGDEEAIRARLPDAWRAMATIRAEVAFATLYAEKLAALSGTPTALMTEIGLLSDRYALVAAAASDLDPVIRGIATSGPIPTNTARGARGIIAAAFDEADTDVPLAQTLSDGKTGEALLRAIAMFNAGIDGDPQLVADALRVLQAAGRGDFARRAALQYLILKRAT